MANRQSGAILRQLQKLLETQPDNESSDAQLLQRFARDRDEAAFETLLQRHGRLVWGVCQHVLHHEQDAEDAFQGTFMVLARKAGSIRNQKAVGSWLYSVAHRIARKVRLSAARRRKRESQATAAPLTIPAADLAWRELQAMLDEELNRLPAKYRTPFVLCCLEGKSKKEAADELGWKEGTVSSRLAQARKLLQGRLARRGVMLSALLCGTAVTQNTASAAVPASLAAVTITAAVTFATGTGPAIGVASAQAVALAQGTLKAMAVSKFTFGAVLLLLLTMVGAGAGMILRQRSAAEPAVAARPEALPALGVGLNNNQKRGLDPAALAAKQMDQAGLDGEGEMTVRGKVLDAGGKPLATAEVAVVAGATRQPGQMDLLTQRDRKVLGSGRTNIQGEFDLTVPRTSFERNFGPGVIVRGAGHGLGWYTLPIGQSESNLQCPLDAGQVVRGKLVDAQGKAAAYVQFHVAGITSRLNPILFYARPTGLGLWPAAVTSDEQGNFLIRDIGPDCTIDLQVSDERFAPQWLSIRTGKEESSKPVTLSLAARRLVEGTVRCEDSGQPVPFANVFVYSSGEAPRGLLSQAEGQTDAQGRFRIAPYPGKTVSVRAYPAKGAPYLVVEQRDTKWPQGASSLQANFALPRGVPISGRVVEAVSGRPVAGATVKYWPRSSANKYLRPDRPGGEILHSFQAARSGPDGGFQFPVTPGPGWLVVKGPGPDYIHTEMSFMQLEYGKAGGQPYFFDAVIPLDLQPGTLMHVVTPTLRRGVTVTGQVVTQDGRPVASGLLLSPTYIPFDFEVKGHTFPVRDGKFALPGCDPDKSVPVLFFDPKSREGAVMELPGKHADGEPVVVRLASFGSASFRCTGSNGQPIQEPRVLLQVLLRPGVPVQESIDRGMDAYLTIGWTQVAGLNCMSLDTRDGTITFSNLIPGATYLVQVWDQRYGYIPKASFTVQPGQVLARTDINLEPAKQ